MIRPRHRLLPLWRDPDFLKLWGGEAVSRIGSQITQLALPLTAVLTLDATPAQVGALTAASYAPFMAVTLFVGVWVDRVRRRPLLIASNLGRAPLIAAVPLLAVLGLLRIEHLYVIAFAVGVLTVVFDVAYQSYVPSLVLRDRLEEGNSRLQATGALAQMGGPGLAGLLIGVATAPVALLVDAASYVVSIGTLSAIRTVEHRPVPCAVRRTVRQSITDGLAFVVRNRYLRACVMESATYNLSFAALQTVFLLYAARELRFGAGTIGLVLSAGAVGSVAGTLAASALKRRLGLGRALVAELALCCLSPALIPAFPGSAPLAAPVFALAFGLCGAGATMANVHVISLRQAITPDQLLGRMNAGYRFVSWSALPIGALLGGTLGASIGFRATLFLTVGGFLLALVWVAVSPLRRLRDLPAGPAT
jgi:MFS family permease